MAPVRSRKRLQSRRRGRWRIACQISSPAAAAIAGPWTKWNGFLDFDTGKFDLFIYDFFCPKPPREGALQLCDPNTPEYAHGSFTVTAVKSLAVLAGVVEIVLPVLLVAGLQSRLSALGLFCMTIFIQLAVFPSWEHWWNPAVWWAVILLLLITRGPGSWSLDHLLRLEGHVRR